METIFIETKFGKVHAKAAGNQGKWLVLGLHGWSQRNGWHTWEPLMQPLANAGFDVVSVDMPGWGQSVPTQGQVKGKDAVSAVLDMLDVLQQVKEYEMCALMGKSWGGGLAIETALNNANRVHKLILTAPAFRDLERLPYLTQPVLLAWAEDDPVIPYTYSAQFAAAIPTCQLETYPTGGHNAAPENASDFGLKAIGFLTQT